ncbi:hypothetical protein D3C85_929470 [compost metagenome]
MGEGGGDQGLLVRLGGDQAADLVVDLQRLIDADPADIAGVVARAAPLSPPDGRALFHAAQTGGGGVSRLGLTAVATQAAHQTLGHDQPQGRGQQEGLHPHVAQARHGPGGVVGVDGGQHQMPGQRGLDRDARRLDVADFTDHDHVRVLAQDGAQARREGHADLGIDLGLAHAVDGVFDRVLDRQDVAGGVVEQRQTGIEAGRLARAGRAGDEDDAVGLAQGAAEGVVGVRVHAQLVQRQAGLILVQNAQHHPLARPRRQGRDAHVQRLAAQRQGDAPVLRHALFGDVEPRHDLDARDQKRRDARVEAQGFAQDAIDPHPHDQGALIGLQVDVRGARAHGLGDDAVDHADDRGVVGGVQQVGGGGQVLDQAVQPRRHVHRLVARAQVARIDVGKAAVELGLIHGLDLQGPPQRPARLDQGQGVRAVAQAHHGDVARVQQDDAVPLGETIGKRGIDQGDHGAQPCGGVAFWAGASGEMVTSPTGAATPGAGLSMARGATGAWVRI